MTAPTVYELTAYVRRGGGLWLAPQSGSSPALFNEFLASGETPLSPASLVTITGDADQREHFEVISPPTQMHPATALLADTERLDLDDVRIYRRYLYTTPLPNDLSVLLRGGQGHPLVIEKTLGKGRVLMQAFPLDGKWSNLPSMQAYVAMVYEWLWYLTEPSQSPLNLSSGGAYDYLLPERSEIEQVTMTSPGGESDPLTITTAADGTRRIRVTETQVPGDYRLEFSCDGKPVDEKGFRVERSRSESDLTRFYDVMLEFLRIEFGMLFDDEKAGTTSVEAAAVARRQEPLWFWLLMGVILFLVGESALAYSIAKNRTLTTPGARLSKAR